MRTVKPLLAALRTAAAVATAFAMTSSAQSQRAQRQDQNAGDYLYKVYCRPCHGETGRGDGPAIANILERPADLTTISARRGGVFPREELIESIDGRRLIAAHRRDMPKWGVMLQSVEDRDEGLIRQRIEALVDYLQTLQRPQ